MKLGKEKPCLECGKLIYIKLYLLKSGRKKYCSIKCRRIAVARGNTGSSSGSWKGGKPKCLECGKLLSTYNVKYCKNHARIGIRHIYWKGDNATYAPLHKWVKRHKGKPKECIKCHKKETLQWANISHQYKRDLEDWFALCAKCHWHYDRDYNHPEILKNRFPEKI